LVSDGIRIVLYINTISNLRILSPSTIDILEVKPMDNLRFEEEEEFEEEESEEGELEED